MKYAGDTPAKKIARLIVWSRIKELLGPKFYSGTHVVLLSPQAGDVSTLLGLGVDLQRIIGVDIDRHAVASARHRFPGLRCLHEDIIAAMERVHGEGVKISSAFLDFCAPLRDETVGKAVEATHYLEPDGILALAVKIGREKGDWSAAVGRIKARSTTGSRAFHLRTEMLTREMLTLANGHRYRACPTDFYRYRSFHGGPNQRSEMLICIAKLSTKLELKAQPLASARKIIRCARKAVISANHQTVGLEASRLAKGGETAHLLLNLKQESIPAYKAHHTRGSYEGVPSPTSRRRH